MSTHPNFDDDNEIEPLLSSTSNSFHDNKKQWYKRASVYWLLPAFTLYSITIGLGLALKVKFYLITVCHNYYLRVPIDDDDEMCNNADVQAVTSQFMMMMNLCSAIPGN